MNLHKPSTQDVLGDLRYLRLLARDFPTISSVTTEIINLQAILHLPKATEHFMADLHGENEAFQHVLRNASGNIKRKVNELFGNTLREQEKKDLCTLIYYPEQKLKLVKSYDSHLSDYYQTTLNQLVTVCRNVSSKYTRSKVRKSLPEEFSYIIEELLHESFEDHNKQAYFNVIIDTIISTGRADDFIIAICYLIQRLAIDQLHILGDIFDRGPGAHLIMDTLCQYHNLDIEWGNHDILWMGAAAGNPCCVAGLLRLSLRYANTQTLEEGYGINMVPLATFAMETYANDDCTAFCPKVDEEQELGEKTLRLIAQMHKAIAIIQFKIEGMLYDRHPEWQMNNRKLLNYIDFDAGTILLDGQTYSLLDHEFPTICPEAPYELTEEEDELLSRIVHSFLISDRLQRHMACLLTHGAMFGIYNSNLLFHASVPMNEDGTLREVNTIGDCRVSGIKLMQKIEQIVRTAFDDGATPADKDNAIDFFWYLWCGPDSPLFDKSKMSTFERYFIADKATHIEERGWYYKLRDNAAICDHVLDEFGVKGSHRHIINGHVPVRVGKGENPIKADGKLMVIDGGFAKAYHDTTGIAGYTLVYHSRGFQLVQHEPFTSTEEAIRNGSDIKSTTQIVEMTGHRAMVNDTDIGIELREQIDDLNKLLIAYRKGYIKEAN